MQIGILLIVLFSVILFVNAGKEELKKEMNDQQQWLMASGGKNRQIEARIKEIKEKMKNEAGMSSVEIKEAERNVHIEHQHVDSQTFESIPKGGAKNIVSKGPLNIESQTISDF
ncbi:hypothetical protein Ddc_18468 [Ditylenchus destructor]|nr:hypothetical protein Ddc_18468 [Ditylenchus destructor]